jgi:signal transduction histidine kinase
MSSQSPANRLETGHTTILGEMAAELIHEVRNPLAAIKGHLEMWRSGAPKAQTPDPAALDLVIAEVVQMERMLANFLGFTRAARRTGSTCGVRETLDYVLRLLEPEARSWGTTMSVHGKAAPMVRADPYFLARVVINLVRNAFRAMPQGGTLRIYVSVKTAISAARGAGSGTRSVEAQGVAEQGAGARAYAVITFADSGSGEQGQDKVYARPGPAHQDGHGIGLALCREIVEGYHGVLTFKRSAVGARVRVILPVAAPAESG